MSEAARRKRKPRKDDGQKVVVRLSEQEYSALKAEATGKMTVSSLVRNRLFGGGVRDHQTLRQVAALHRVGMGLTMLADQVEPDRGLVDDLLFRTRQLIDRLAEDVSGTSIEPDDS